MMFIVLLILNPLWMYFTEYSLCSRAINNGVVACFLTHIVGDSYCDIYPGTYPVDLPERHHEVTTNIPSDFWPFSETIL